MAKTNPFQYIQQVRSEVSKVVWPTRREVLLTTGMVVAMAALTALFFSLVDLRDPLRADQRALGLRLRLPPGNTLNRMGFGANPGANPLSACNAGCTPVFCCGTGAGRHPRRS